MRFLTIFLAALVLAASAHAQTWDNTVLSDKVRNLGVEFEAHKKWAGQLGSSLKAVDAQIQADVLALQNKVGDLEVRIAAIEGTQPVDIAAILQPLVDNVAGLEGRVAILEESDPLAQLVASVAELSMRAQALQLVLNDMSQRLTVLEGGQ